MSNRSNSRTDSRIDELLYNANDLDNLGSSEDTEWNIIIYQSINTITK